MQTIAEVIERAAAEERGGRAWRAREILLGNIQARSYKQHSSEPAILDLYRAYGELLVRLGEAMEGGRYLFLSGHRGTDAHTAVELYLSRFKRAAPNELVRSFPARARLEKLSDYPAPVAALLKERGVSDSVPVSLLDRPLIGPSSGAGLALAWLASAAMVLLFIAPWFIGLGTAIYWVGLILAYFARAAT